MIKLFVDSAAYVKIFSTAFVGLAAMTTGAFYYVGSKYNQSYENSMLEIYKNKEILIAKEKQLAKLREIHIPS